MNRVKVGFFSLSHHSPSGDDRPYLEWHQMDHMPEQYQLPGLVLGQRWASTPACRAARAAGDDGWSQVEHVVCYLMGNPVDETIDEFLTLGRHLAELGRFPDTLPSQYRGALRLLETQAAPTGPRLARGGALPAPPGHLPHRRGAHRPGRPRMRTAQRTHVEVLPELVPVPGVAGAWAFGTTPSIRRPMFTEGDYRMTVCYLDDDPAAVGERLRRSLDRRWGGRAGPAGAGRAVRVDDHWDWDRFAAAG